MVSLCCFCSGMRLTRRAVPSLPRIKFTRMHGFAYDSLLPNGLTSRHIGAHPVGADGSKMDRTRPACSRLARGGKRLLLGSEGSLTDHIATHNQLDLIRSPTDEICRGRHRLRKLASRGQILRRTCRGIEPGNIRLFAKT